jgi:4-amino-4-deoxy-L-arabinose transferase-like glycosyltransferase
MAPGYPTLLWLAWSLLGEVGGAFAVSLLQAFAISAVVFPVHELTRRWFDERTATLALWIVVGFPLYGWYATRLHHTAVDMSLYPWVIAAWLRLGDRPTWPGALGAGALSGLAGLFQPLILCVAGPLACCRLALALRSRDRATTSLFVAGGLVALAVLAPWTARNAHVQGRLVPVKSGFGKELWLGNNPNATGTAYAIGGQASLEGAHPYAGRGADAPEGERFAAMRAEAWAYIRAQPGAFLARTARKVLWLWTAAPADRVRRTQGGEGSRYRWALLASWAALALCAAAGAWLRRPLAREYLFLLSWVFTCYSVVYGLTHVGQARYRGEVEFFLIPLAAAGALGLIERARRRP